MRRMSAAMSFCVLSAVGCSAPQEGGRGEPAEPVAQPVAAPVEERRAGGDDPSGRREQAQQVEAPLAPYVLPEWLARGDPSPDEQDPGPVEPIEQQLAALPPGDPQRADLLMRLAKAHSFLAERSDSAGVREPHEAEAVRTLAILCRDFPQHQASDEALMRLGHALGRRGEMQQARTVYHRLVRDHPTSRYIPHVYGAFGDYYFGEGDMSSALQFYERVAQYEASPLHAYALYRAAQCLAAMDDLAGAMQRLDQVVQFADQHPEAPEAAVLSEHAEREFEALRQAR